MLRWWGGKSDIGVPDISTRPSFGFSNPARSIRSVVLPEPLEPSKAKNFALRNIKRDPRSPQ